MSAFSDALTVLVNDPNFGADAVYKPQGGSAKDIRVAIRIPQSVDMGVGGARSVSAPLNYGICVSDVPVQPNHGDSLTVNGTPYTIQSAVPSARRLMWYVSVK